MVDAMFLQSLISLTQDKMFEIRDEALKWYKRLNHRLILYQDSSSVPEMASFERKKSYVDMTLVETEEYPPGHRLILLHSMCLRTACIARTPQ